MIAWLKKCYKKIFPDGSGKMLISRGKFHDYLGMKLDFLKQGEVVITMILYIQEMIEVFNQADKSGKISKTPAADNLFEVDEDSPLLDNKWASIFHTSVAKALFLTKRARPVISVTVDFLTT